mmetsp:Transcript_12752/g.26004  ORF Transcript_12752/g.26004 Transcript_12752/m.26004 type:complete len:316 (-) Transcript_12752:303-1250(-)
MRFVSFRFVSFGANRTELKRPILLLLLLLLLLPLGWALPRRLLLLLLLPAGVWIGTKVRIPVRIGVAVVDNVATESAPALAKLKESSEAGANVRAIRLEFDQEHVLAVALVQGREAILVEGVLDQVVVVVPCTGNLARQAVVVDGHRHQPSVSDRVVGGREGSDEGVVVQEQVAELDEFLAEVFREGSRQLVATNVEVDALAPSQVGGNRAGESVRVDVEVSQWTNPADRSGIGSQFPGKGSRQGVVGQVQQLQGVQHSNPRGESSGEVVAEEVQFLQRHQIVQRFRNLAHQLVVAEIEMGQSRQQTEGGGNGPR